MQNAELKSYFEKATLALDGVEEFAEAIEWNDHPKYKGVRLKHLIRGEATKDRFSCHLVMVEPGCELGEHNHPEQWELHAVLAGGGVAHLESRTIEYHPGRLSLIPISRNHRVLAGPEGLLMLAQFAPALL